MTSRSTGKPAGWRFRAVIALAATAGLLGIPNLAQAAARPSATAPARHTGIAGPASGLSSAFEEVASSSIPAKSKGTRGVSCPTGDVATGGGGTTLDNQGVVMFEDFPLPAAGGSGLTPTGWSVSWKNTTGATATVFTYAICV